MIDHLSLNVQDFDTMAAYYTRVLATVGYRKGVEYPATLQLINPTSEDSVWLAAAETAGGAEPVHIAWHAEGEDAVRAFYREAMQGGKDNGAPGPRDYEPGYYACFVFDPEGNNIEAVYRATRG